MRSRLFLLILSTTVCAAPDDGELKQTWKSIRRGFRWLDKSQDKGSGLFDSKLSIAHCVATTALVLDGLMECGGTRGNRLLPVASRVLHKGLYGLVRIQSESGRFLPKKGPMTYAEALACHVLVRDGPMQPDPRLRKHVVRARRFLRRAQREDGSWALRLGDDGDPVLTSVCARVLGEEAGRAGRYLMGVLGRKPLKAPARADDLGVLVPKSPDGRLAAVLVGVLRTTAWPAQVDLDEHREVWDFDDRLTRRWLAVHPLGEQRDDPAHAYWLLQRLAWKAVPGPRSRPREMAAAKRWLAALRDALVAGQSTDGSWRFPGRSQAASTALALWCLGHPLWYLRRGSRFGELMHPVPPPLPKRQG